MKDSHGIQQDASPRRTSYVSASNLETYRRTHGLIKDHTAAAAERTLPSGWFRLWHHIVASPNHPWCTAETPSWRHADIETLMSPFSAMLHFDEGWDGNAGRRIERKTWEKAADFLSVLVHQLEPGGLAKLRKFELRPLRSGGIDILWPRSSSYLVIRIPPNEASEISWALNPTNARPTGNVIHDLANLNEVILDFISE